jgi:hypothetical protein
MRRRAPRIAGRRALRRLGHGLRSKARRARLRVAVPAAGRLIARVRIRRGRKHVLVASGHVRARRRGTVRLTVRTTRAGRRLLTRHGHKRRASIRLTFQPLRGRPAKIVVARRI